MSSELMSKYEKLAREIVSGDEYPLSSSQPDFARAVIKAWLEATNV